MSNAGDGTKVTSDPSSQREPVREGAGVITSDSLAGESISQGGAFAQKNPGVGAMQQSSASTTTNTTDTSGATVLPPAVDAEAREAEEGWGEESKLHAGQGLSSGGSQSYSGAAGGSSSGSSGSGNYGQSETQQSGPRGQNLKEGGFSSDDPNASFSTDIGGENDPGRAALKKMETSSAPSAAGGEGPRQYGDVSGGQYDALDESSA